MKATNLNPLFIDLAANFAHLLTVEAKTKDQFLQTVKETYDVSNPKTQLFYIACQKSEFETIRLINNRDAILFNQ